jgi:hypothetical protein
MISAHRLAWVLAHGRIPNRMRVLHRCDLVSCVRIDHLWLGTSLQNTQDMIDKGRDSFGHARQMSQETVRQIRARRAEGKTVTEVALEFGIRRNHASGIISGKRWRVSSNEKEVA